MMAKSKATVTVEGVETVRRALADLPAKVEQAAVAALRDAAEAIQQRARADVPVASGALQRGIEIAYVEGGRAAEIGTRDPRLYYAAFVEYGTSSQTAKPFLRPAAEAERARIASRVGGKVKAAVE